MTLHEVFTPFENNISQCEPVQIHNVIIFSFTNLFNGLLDMSDMHFWIRIRCIHQIWKWQILKHLIVLAIQKDNTVVGSIIFMLVQDLATMVQNIRPPSPFLPAPEDPLGRLGGQPSGPPTSSQWVVSFGSSGFDACLPFTPIGPSMPSMNVVVNFQTLITISNCGCSPCGF